MDLKLFLTALASSLKGAEIINGDKPTPILTVPNDRRVVDMVPLIKAFEAVQSAPYRRRGLYSAADIASLLKWGDNNAVADQPIFAAGLETLAKPGMWKAPILSMTLIANYSTLDTEKGAGFNAPAWHDLQAQYRFPISEQWLAWAGGDSTWVDQGDFAQFIENRMPDLTSRVGDTATGPGEAIPDYLQALIASYGDGAEGAPGDILTLSRGLEITVNSGVKAAVRLQSGETEISYTEEHSQGAAAGKVKVPSLFWIRIPLFLDSTPQLVGVRLRYRVLGGKVKWSYALYAPERVVADTFHAYVEVAIAAGRTVYFGAADLPVVEADSDLPMLNASPGDSRQ